MTMRHFGHAGRMRLFRADHWIFRVMPIALALWGCSNHVPPPAEPPKFPSLNLALIRDALSFEGSPYTYGGDDPEEGFDCSGFVRYIYQRHGVDLPRTAQGMATALEPVPFHHKKTGDLVFFNTNGSPFSHVGIVTDSDHFIHASTAKRGVVISELESPYWSDRLTGVRRPPSKMDRIGFKLEEKRGN